MSTAKDMLQLALMADLKAAPVQDKATAFFAGKTAIGDGLGGLYFWDAAATGDEDTKFLNVLTSTFSSTGRWVRVFQRARQLPQGVLVTNGGVKTLFATGVTDSNGECTLNLTLENNASGTPIFSEIWSNNSRARTVSATPGGAVQSFVMSEAVDLKTTKHGFYKANVVTIALGLLYNPFIMVAAGTTVNFRIEGV